MADYISRETAIDYIKRQQCKKCSDIGLCGNCAVLVAIKLLETVPAADAEPVRHGQWEGYTHSRYCGIDKHGEPIFRDATVYYCSSPKCRRKTVVEEKFCPECGAKMDRLEDQADG